MFRSKIFYTLVIMICIFVFLYKTPMQRCYADIENYKTEKAIVEDISYGTHYHWRYGYRQDRIYIEVITGHNGEGDIIQIVGNNYNVVEENDIFEKIKPGDVIEFISVPRYFGDGYCIPIAGLKSEQTELLSFDEGYKNLLIYVGWNGRPGWLKFLAIFIICMIIRQSIIRFRTDKQYKKLINNYSANELQNLDKKANKIQRKYLRQMTDFFLRKESLLRYNNLCWLLASNALVLGKEEKFIVHLYDMKEKEICEKHCFALALFFAAKNSMEAAIRYYEEYNECQHQNRNIEIIMNILFDEKSTYSEMEVRDAVKSFDDPAIKILFKQNNILACDE